MKSALSLALSHWTRRADAPSQQVGEGSVVSMIAFR